ncbi:MAG TPA: TetR/AcrR family transcriptional regulator [Spirochaetota bacterium]|nr:TetR/AcrR family transcriptional regulator [Spirochaetota bacterium]HPJ38702.1 TetR/AcrR family transcriptional regulator [Spirochaetota bacterium]
METRKQHIVTVSKKLFSEKGFSGTGLREIAETAGVSLGNIYNYFKNKEEIFHHTLDPEIVLGSLGDIPEILQDGFPFNLNALILKIKNIVDQNFELYSLIFIDLIEFAGKNTNRIVEHIIAFSRHAYDQYIKDGPGATVLKELDIDFHLKALVLSAVSFFIISNILPSININNYSDGEIAGKLSDVILHGVLA